jgi:RimJ/RimL family protein N-acetyltransferase
MISFSVINDENKDEKLNIFPKDERAEAAEYIASALDFGYDEVAVCYYMGMLLIRVYDGEYYVFISPIPLASGACEMDGVRAVREYAVKEDIPLFFADVPLYLFDDTRDYFADVDFDVSDDGECAEVTVNSPADASVRIPTIECDRVVLAGLTSDEIEDYAHLSTEESGLRYYGYSYGCEVESPSAEYFYERQLYDYTVGLAMTFGVYFEGELIGECVLHHFDLIGGAEISIRLLPEHRGLGFGREILTAVIRYKAILDIDTLYATVHRENAASVGLFSSVMDEYRREGELIYYKF